MSRKANGQGYTYKVGKSYRTVIRRGDQSVTAMAPSAQLSRQRAKDKIEKLPKLLGNKNSLPQSKIALGKYLLQWLEEEHKHQIAHSTWKRYRALAVHHIVPVIGQIPLRKIVPSDIQFVLTTMREGGQSPRSQQQARVPYSPMAETVDRELLPLVPSRAFWIFPSNLFGEFAFDAGNTGPLYGFSQGRFK